MTGHELRKLRLSLGLSQEDFAHDVLGVTGVTISRWECEVAKIDQLKADGIKARVTAWKRRKPKKTF